MKKIVISLSIIAVVAVMAVGATTAYFTDTETSSGNTFTAGNLDLKIDLQCDDELCSGFSLRDLHGEVFFKECDVKPGDDGEVTISWHVFDNNAWGRIRLEGLYEYENGCNEPEGHVDASCGDAGLGEGELDDHLKFSVWMDEGETAGWQCPDGNNGPCEADLMEGDNIFNGVEIYLAENTSVSNLVSGVEIPEELVGLTTYYMGFQWSVDGSVGNVIQTDSLGGNIVMEIVQSRNNPTPWATI